MEVFRLGAREVALVRVVVLVLRIGPGQEELQVPGEAVLEVQREGPVLGARVGRVRGNAAVERVRTRR